MKVRYTVLDGEIVEENRNGVIADYVADPLGSTVALLDGSHSKSDTFNYWPYGEVQSRSGSTPTPFQFVGTLGYYRDSSSRTYVRARHYRQNLGRWQTVDSLWPGQDQFGYVRGRVVSYRDRSGLFFGYGNWCGPRNGPDEPINKVDECCRDHDRCLATPCDWFTKKPICDLQLCACVARNFGDGCRWWQVGCWCGQWSLLKYACTNSLNPTPLPWPGLPPGIEDLCFVFG